ncbi:MAG: adenylate kinase [Synergistetes bacterium]|nr:adenylate kinase [Synergistota bacterium]
MVFLGPPGAGKGTQASLLKSKYGIAHISTGDILREAVKKGTELGKKAREYMDRGLLVPDEIIIGIIEERLAEPDAQKGFILDGFPRTIPQAEALDRLLEKKRISLNAVFLFNANKETILERLTGRRVCKKCGALYHIRYSPPKIEGVCDKCGGELYQRDDDKEETILRRLDVYRNQTEPLIDHYRKKGILIELDANKDSKEVLAEIERWMNSGN